VTTATEKDRFENSRGNHARASLALAGGVATAFRAAQLPIPITFVRGSGSRLFDLDGHEYVDFALSFGPLILGHTPAPVLEAVREQMGRGLGFGASHELEAVLAEAVCRTVPSAELCVFGTTGSEAVHVAIRIARAATGRRRVIKFLGHYHGWHDTIYTGVPWQLRAEPGTGGQDEGALTHVSVIPWNDLHALEQALEGDIAAVIMEPLHANGGCVLPTAGYLEGARELTASAGAALIFDEVITGYRLSLGGAQELFGVTPDLTVLGKALGGGFPISAVCGREEWMAPVVDNRVAHVGTFNANPIAAAAAVAAISFLEAQRDQIYPRLSDSAEQLVAILREEGQAHDLPIQAHAFPGVAHAFFADKPVESYAEACASDRERFRRLSGHLLEAGVHVIPRGLLYVSTEHRDIDLDEARAGVRQACQAMRDEERI
jgi:glutamate-1-semialdehyde 2,1-aminomutase